MFSTYDQRTRDLILEAIWTHSLIGLAIVDEKGRFKKANPTFCKYVEYTEAELCSKTFAEITLPEDVEWDMEMCRRVIAQEQELFDMPKRYITKFHNVIKILLRATGVVKDNEFLFFISQAVLIEQALPLIKEIESTPKPSRLWLSMQKNWPIIAFMTTLLLAAIGNIAVVLSK